MDEREISAREFLEKNNIMQLFEELNARVLVERPENVREFLIQELERMEQAKAEGTPQKWGFFTQKDVEAMFGALSKGTSTVSLAQVKQAILSVGGDVEKADLSAITGPIQKDEFMNIILKIQEDHVSNLIG
eukprot:GCRY01001855.1.p1 GENE.GCRY01001855.1~~GCRY01001855.1.p1  ORF type:complete len:132 (+),score=25.08 GCRY01001855.1:203-598(+)